MIFAPEEIKDGIAKMRIGTSADKYGTCAEVLAYLGLEACGSIGAAFVRRATGGDEGSWTPLSMALLPKVARPTKPNQFRAIELAHALGKLWDSILESRLCYRRGQPSMGVRLASRKSNNRPGTDPTLHVAGLRGKRPGPRLRRSRYLEMFRYRGTWTGAFGMHQEGGPPAYLRSIDKGVPGSYDLHSRARQHKRRGCTGTRTCTRKEDQRLVGNIMHFRHTET